MSAFVSKHACESKYEVGKQNSVIFAMIINPRESAKINTKHSCACPSVCPHLCCRKGVCGWRSTPPNLLWIFSGDLSRPTFTPHLHAPPPRPTSTPHLHHILSLSLCVRSNEKTNRGVLHWVKSWDNKVGGGVGVVHVYVQVSVLV